MTSITGRALIQGRLFNRRTGPTETPRPIATRSLASRSVVSVWYADARQSDLVQEPSS